MLYPVGRTFAGRAGLSGNTRFISVVGRTFLSGEIKQTRMSVLPYNMNKSVGRTFLSGKTRFISVVGQTFLSGEIKQTRMSVLPLILII